LFKLWSHAKHAESAHGRTGGGVGSRVRRCGGGGGAAANRVPRIAGQHFPYLRRQIEAAGNLHKDFAPPEMNAALRGTGAQERDALADYISRLAGADPLLDSQRPRPP